MIKLEEYGFIKTSETDRQMEYEGHGFIVTIYNYPYMTFDKKEVARSTFLVSSQQFTSRSRPMSELTEWLMEKNILKI